VSVAAKPAIASWRVCTDEAAVIYETARDSAELSGQGFAMSSCGLDRQGLQRFCFQGFFSWNLLYPHFLTANSTMETWRYSGCHSGLKYQFSDLQWQCSDIQHLHEWPLQKVYL